MRPATAIATVGLALCAACAVPAARAADAADIEELKARVTALERRVADLEARARPKNVIIMEHEERPQAAEPPALSPEQQAALMAARERLDRLAQDAARYAGPLVPTPGVDRDAVMLAWAEAGRDFVCLLAESGLEAPCLTALADFRTAANKTSAAQAVFEQAAYDAAEKFRTRWHAPDSAMRLAAAYGPRATDTAAAWGRLCEACALDADSSAYAALALRCYLRAVSYDPNLPDAWDRVRALEAALGIRSAN